MSQERGKPFSLEDEDSVPHLVYVEATRRTTFQGPLPPPEVLQQYGEVRPDLVDRIVTMAERQGEHRRAIESKIVEASLRNSGRGQLFGLIIGLFGLGAAALCVIQGHGISGTIIGTVDLVALVSVFVLGRRRRAKRQVEHARIPPERAIPEAPTMGGESEEPR